MFDIFISSRRLQFKEFRLYKPSPPPLLPCISDQLFRSKSNPSVTRISLETKPDRKVQHIPGISGYLPFAIIIAIRLVLGQDA